jgi:hypothetical protein
VTIVLVVVLFEIWFFFYSPSPIDQRSGRSHRAPLIGAVATRDPRPQLVIKSAGGREP